MLETMKTKPIQSPDSAAVSSAEPPEIDVEVPAKPKRRRFTAKYKLRVLDEVDAAGPGEQGAILRREGLYSSHISEWRAARREGALGGLSKRRGRKVNPNRAAEKKIAQLERELARTQEALRKAHLILEVQGKVAGLLGLNFDHEKTS
jgi:transposase-like protein